MVPAGDRVVVVGAGFIGGAVARTLVDRGHRVTVLTRGTSEPLAMGGGARVVVGDALDEAVVHDALIDARAVVYCAGGALPAEAERDPAAELRRATLPLLAALAALRERPGVPLLFMSSGGTVYGEPDQLPVHESHPLRPRTAYAVAKAAAEQYLGIYRELHGVPTTSLRCANVYGPGQVPYRSQGVVATMLASASSGREVVVYGDGGALRDYIFIDDVADVVAALLTKDELPSAINLGTGVGTRLDTLLSLVEETVQRPLRLRFEPKRPTDLERVVLDVGRLRGLVPFEPVEFADGLRRTWDCESTAAADAR